MFTGLDFIVVLVVIGLMVYATSTPSEKPGVKLEPLTVLVVMAVVAMIIVSIT